MLHDFIDRLGSLFTARYAQSNANIVQILMYRIAYPVAVLLDRVGLSPNQITTASLGFTGLAFLALVYAPGWSWFCLFWGISVLLDVCDGTVARMAGKVSKTAFRYDHMSDLFKIALIILGAGIRYNEPLVWVVAFAAGFAFLYGDALNRELGIALDREKRKAEAETASSSAVAGDPPARENDVLRRIYRQLRAVLLTVNGHTLLLFFVLPLGREAAIWGLSYLIFVELLAIRSRIVRLVGMRR